MRDNGGDNCARCGETFIAEGAGTGYGINAAGERICYQCCAVLDREQMTRDGRATLYFSGAPGERTITNWPGTLKLRVGYVKTGRHNIAGRRYDAWFTGPAEDGSMTARWHGVQYGDNTQIIHCRRLKGAAS